MEAKSQSQGGSRRSGDSLPGLPKEAEADGWVLVSAKIEGGDTTTADQIIDIVLKEAAINLASHFTGPITDLISRRQVEEDMRNN